MLRGSSLYVTIIQTALRKNELNYHQVVVSSKLHLKRRVLSVASTRSRGTTLLFFFFLQHRSLCEIPSSPFSLPPPLYNLHNSIYFGINFSEHVKECMFEFANVFSRLHPATCRRCGNNREQPLPAAPARRPFGEAHANNPRSLIVSPWNP